MTRLALAILGLLSWLLATVEDLAGWAYWRLGEVRYQLERRADASRPA